MSATKKLKIALLIKHLSFPINGFIQDLVWQLYKHLSLMGNEVTLVKGVSRR